MVEDMDGHSTTYLLAGQYAELLAHVSDCRYYIVAPQPFHVIIEVMDANGIVQDLQWQAGIIDHPNYNLKISVPVAWIPEQAGDPTIQTLIIESFENPRILSVIRTLDVVAVQVTKIDPELERTLQAANNDEELSIIIYLQRLPEDNEPRRISVIQKVTDQIREIDNEGDDIQIGLHSGVSGNLGIGVTAKASLVDDLLSLPNVTCAALDAVASASD